jgi:hypothetical protein
VALVDYAHIYSKLYEDESIEVRLYGFIKNAVKKGNNSYYTK